MADIKQLNDNTPVKWKDLKENAEYAKQYVERKIAESASDTDSKLDEVKNDVVSIIKNIGARVYIQDSEPDDKDYIWIKPVNHSRMLMLNNNPEESDFVSSIDDRDYGIENAVKNTSDITKSNYCFDIIK